MQISPRAYQLVCLIAAGTGNFRLRLVCLRLWPGFTSLLQSQNFQNLPWRVSSPPKQVALPAIMSLSWNYYIASHAYGMPLPSFDIRIVYGTKTAPMPTNLRHGPGFPNPDRPGPEDDGEDSESASDDDYDDDDEDETFIYLYPSPEPRRLDPGSQLALRAGTVSEAAIARFLRTDVVRYQAEGDQRFACPFYLRNPSQHRACIRDDLRRIIDVKRHLWARHRRPYDCPVCGATFDAPAACDNHIRRGECTQTEAQNLAPAEAVSEDQLQLLAQPPSPGCSNNQQWEDIWRIVFPRDRPLSQAARQDAFLRQAVAVRNFWDEQGATIIAQVLLETPSEPENLRKRDKRALWDTVLVAMIDKLVAGDLLG